jgi:hypothetical protein
MFFLGVKNGESQCWGKLDPPGGPTSIVLLPIVVRTYVRMYKNEPGTV